MRKELQDGEIPACMLEHAKNWDGERYGSKVLPDVRYEQLAKQLAVLCRLTWPMGRDGNDSRYVKVWYEVCECDPDQIAELSQGARGVVYLMYWRAMAILFQRTEEAEA